MSERSERTDGRATAREPGVDGKGGRSPRRIVMPTSRSGGAATVRHGCVNGARRHDIGRADGRSGIYSPALEW